MSETAGIIRTPNRAVQLRVQWVLYSTGGFYAALSEYQASKSRRNGPNPNDFAPTHRCVLVPAQGIPALLRALGQIEAVVIERGDLRAEHYEQAGLEVPPGLRRVA